MTWIGCLFGALCWDEILVALNFNQKEFLFWIRSTGYPELMDRWMIFCEHVGTWKTWSSWSHLNFTRAMDVIASFGNATYATSLRQPDCSKNWAENMNRNRMAISVKLWRRIFRRMKFRNPATVNRFLLTWSVVRLCFECVSFLLLTGRERQFALHVSCQWVHAWCLLLKMIFW